MGFRILFAVLLLLLLAGEASQISSQQKPGAASPPYAIENEQTLQGNVEQTGDYDCPVTGTVGSHITVVNGSGKTEIHLAPATFMKQYEIVFKRGDAVKVLGIKVTFDDKPAMLARSVTVCQDTYIFRDGKGRPLW